MKIKPEYFNAEKVTEIWLDYYHELTGNTDKPHYSEGGCLLHWISEYAPMNQTDIIHICYEVGYKAGLRAAKQKAEAV